MLFVWWAFVSTPPTPPPTLYSPNSASFILNKSSGSSDTKHIKYCHVVAPWGAQMGASAAAGAEKTDPSSSREWLCIISMGPLFLRIQLGHTLRGAAVLPRGANSITGFNLGNEKDALPSLPSQNAAHTDFTTDFTVRLCLQKWGEKRGTSWSLRLQIYFLPSQIYFLPSP